MSGPITLTEVDFEEIKDNLISYLKSTKQFVDYDFSGSNLQVILSLIAYQAQLNAYSTNLVANESFLNSAVIRKNVVANARSLGYTPTSARCAFSIVDFVFELTEKQFPSGFPQTLQIDPGMVFSSNGGAGNFIFNTTDVQTANVTGDGKVYFNNVVVHEGSYVNAEFTVDLSNYDQKFIIENKNIDSSTIRVEVREDPTQAETYFYRPAENLVELTEESRVYWLEEVDLQYYQLTFGDGYFGKKLEDGAIITVTYIISSGPEANGIQGTSNFNFVGKVFYGPEDRLYNRATVTSVSKTEGGAFIEEESSIKFRAPREYAAQNRCVVAEDYDTLVRKVFPAVEDIYVYGGETLDIPEYGRVYVVIKPRTGLKLSNISKNYIKKSLDPYRVASLDIIFVDPEILNVEVVSDVYFDEKRTLMDNSAIIATVNESLSKYVSSVAVPKFGGAVRYSTLVGIIDESNGAITRNNTHLRMRKDFSALINQNATYEICFDQTIDIDHEIPSVYSTGFQLELNGSIDERIFYFENDPKTNRPYSESNSETISDIYAFYLNEFNEKVKVNFYMNRFNQVIVQGCPTTGYRHHSLWNIVLFQW